MTSFTSRNRDDFLEALEEARRAAQGDEDEQAGTQAQTQAQAASHGSAAFLGALDRMAGKVRSYISAHLLARLYADPGPEPEPDEPRPPPRAQPPPAPTRSEHDSVVDELHLTPRLTPDDLKQLRRTFAK